MSLLKRSLLALGLLALATPALSQRIVEWTEQQGELGLGYPVPTPVDTALPFDGFRSYAGLASRHQDLMNGSDRIHGEIIGQTREGRDIRAYRLAAPGRTTPEGLARGAILYVGGVHAREWQSPEVVTGLMERFVAGTGDRSITDFVAEHVGIVVVPVTNIDGFVHTQANPSRNWLDVDFRFPDFWPRDGRMRRKNLRDNDGDFFTAFDLLNGVDINRNNPPFWPGPPETGEPDDLTWRGPSPLSEPENQALTRALDLVGVDRLRFYADMHSYTQQWFSVRTGNERTNAIQSRLFQTLSNHHADLPGNVVYVDTPGGIDTGIGTTSEYFAHTYQIPSATWEIEPGQQAGVQYGGFGNNSHDGFILPESEIRRVRENLAETMLVAAYHMAGPPHVVAAEVTDVASQAVVWSAHWSDAGPEGRDRIQQSLAPLVPGREYELRVAFSKPMRWREDGEIVPFPGRSSGSINTLRWLERDGEILDMDFGPDEWLDEPGGAPDGFHRYRDDAFRTRFTIADTAANRALIEAGGETSAAFALTVLASDLTGSLPDSDPSTPVVWSDGAWVGYDSDTGSVDFGGVDRSFSLEVSVVDEAPEPYAVRAAHSAMWIDPARAGEGWVIEILPNGQALGYWFTYDEAGEPRWLLGQGPIVENQIFFDELLAPVGGRFGPDFDPDDVELVPAGSARLVFTGCDSGWI
ncbi:MAG: M14 family metallopeptidase, partial [Wenzhouxiangella sp.]|nr:M14 family metallopeptidase [Wenzhouxiangella sp.]